VDDRHALALDRILEVVVLLNDDMTRRLARDGLTVSRTHLLWELRRRGPSTQRVLADALGVSARTVTGLVDGLAATGFVTRELHPSDRRATLVTFTPRGVRVVAAMERDQAEFAHILFGGMPQRRFDGLVAGLGDVLDRLRAQGLTHRVGKDER
jgi:DNA-binding MarR family transcriptional regulator